MMTHEDPQSPLRKSPGLPHGLSMDQPEPEPRKPWTSRHKILTVLAAAAALAGVVVLAGLTHLEDGQSSPPASATMQTVATFTGSGDNTTAKFAVSGTWELGYTFDCSGFGDEGNFQVYEDGSKVMVNDLAESKNATTYAYDDAGTHYLQVNSECDWTVTVASQP